MFSRIDLGQDYKTTRRRKTKKAAQVLPGRFLAGFQVANDGVCDAYSRGYDGGSDIGKPVVCK